MEHYTTMKDLPKYVAFYAHPSLYVFDMTAT